MLGECIASESEVIRAIVSDYSPWCAVPHSTEQHRRQQSQEDERRSESERARPCVGISLCMSVVVCILMRRRLGGAHGGRP